jgi:hypothetical protein
VILLFHGTSDDSSKYENWMRWIDQMMSDKGETVLTIEGVGAKGKSAHVGAHDGWPANTDEDHGWQSVGPSVLQFIQGLRFTVPGASGVRPITKLDRLTGHSAAGRNRISYPALLRALNEAGGDEFPKAARVPPGQEETLVQDLATAKLQHPDGPKVGTGIKYRAAVASIAAVAYVRQIDTNAVIKIIGHSRGGSTAVAVHNILTYHGIKCDTLTLDPCHGKKKFQPKEYYRKIWDGRLVNQPNNKNVAVDWLADIFMERPAITKGEGAAASCSIVNRARTKNVKHGHMGKLQRFGKDADGTAGKANLGLQISTWITQNAPSLSKQRLLMQFFQRFIGEPNTKVGIDKRLIAKLVIENLTGPLPPCGAFWSVS